MIQNGQGTLFNRCYRWQTIWHWKSKRYWISEFQHNSRVGE